MSRQKAELVGLMIENNLFHVMQEGKPMEVQSTIQQTASPSYIKKIRLLSVEGKICAVYIDCFSFIFNRIERQNSTFDWHKKC